MVHGAVKTLFRALGVALVCLLLVIPLVSWRLAQGPVSLDSLAPAIERALAAQDGSFSVRLGTTVLMAGEGDRMLEIHALDVRAYGADPSRPLVTIPDMAFSLSGRALLSGVIAPNTVRLTGASLRLVRRADGGMDWGIGGGGAAPAAGSGAVLDRIRDALLGDPDPAKPGRTLHAFALNNAEVVVEDRLLGTQWRIPDADFILRRVHEGLTATAHLRLDIGGAQVGLGLEAAYHRADGSGEAVLRLDGLRPSALAGLGPALAPLAGADLPLSGMVRARLGGDGGLDELEFDIVAGAGTVILPQPMTGEIRLAGGEARGGFRRATGQAEVSRIRLDLGGPVLTAQANAEGIGTEAGGALRVEAGLRDVPVDRLRDLWPAGVGQNARDWVIPNLSRGMVRLATLSLAARLPASGNPAEIAIERIGGEIRAAGVSVDYLAPMPPARGVDAVVAYDAGTMRIAISSGEVYGLRLKEGTVVFTGLDQVDQFADIALSVVGPVPDALRLIDNPPLRYARALGIDPTRTGGSALTRLSLKFPLLKALRLDDLDIRAQASMTGLSLPRVALGQDLEGGALEMTIDAGGLDATGTVILGGIPASLVWHETFSAKPGNFRSRYTLKAARLDEDQRRRLGLDGVPFVAPFIAGPVGVDVTIGLGDGERGQIDARVDLAPARMELPGLGWTKEAGRTGTAEVTVRLDRDRIAGVPRFTVRAGDLDLVGQVAFADGSARRVDFTRLAYGRTEGTGTIGLRPQGKGIDINFLGSAFDAAPVLARSGSGSGDGAAADKPPPMTVTATIEDLWVSDTGVLTDARLSMARDAADWRSLSLAATVPGGRAVTAALSSAANGRRSFSIASDDAGAVARVFGVYDDLVGGTLSIDGWIDDSRPSQPLVGTVRVSDYHIRNAPALARLLTVAALTGIVDVLRGEGVGFSSLDAPFVMTNGLIELKNARAWGAALGITARGRIDLDRSRLAIEGTVVPAYVLNSVLGEIPVLGWLITGGEKGGGVIAFNYAMKGPSNDPSVSVNPLSALTPGFLRQMFNLFDDAKPPPGRDDRSDPKE